MAYWDIPDSMYFLHYGWWIFHVIVVSLVLLLGYWIGNRSRLRRSGDMGPVGIPQVYRFLEPGWWGIHAVMIPVIFYLGHLFWQ